MVNRINKNYKEKKAYSKKQKKIDKKLKIKEQYPNRSDYRLLLSIKPIGIMHDLYKNFIKFLNYADKAGTVFQFVMSRRNKKND